MNKPKFFLPLSPMIRHPVKRQGAEKYLLITLLSFAASVTLTRLFLQLTGYPQIGGGELHIAHVLWGGLILFLAALLPILIANRWVYTTSSLLAGIGVGLFIDEVGKFITQSNDYFFPLAAPIIYAFFLLTVLLYLRVRRPPARDSRAELFWAFDALEEVLEHDLDPQELTDLQQRLNIISQDTNQPDLARMANELLQYLTSDAIKLVRDQDSLWERGLNKWRHLHTQYLTRFRLKAFLAGGLLAVGVFALLNLVHSLPFGPLETSLAQILNKLVEEGQISSLRGLNWFMARLALESTVGILLVISAGLFIAGKDHLGVALGYLGLLLSLAAVNLLIFYFDQFSTILIATIQFILLLAVIDYRRRFLNSTPIPTSPETGEKS